MKISEFSDTTISSGYQLVSVEYVYMKGTLNEMKSLSLQEEKIRLISRSLEFVTLRTYVQGNTKSPQKLQLQNKY